ncbi:MAG: TatD family hydrolase, partial [Elusimicrobiota bacterium]|nr:TatD family hydrolase [Elusimicrobiota bacterium]
REEVIKRAHNIGITKIFEVVCEQNLWNKGVEIAKKDNIFISFGIHPHEAKTAVQEDFVKLENLINNEKCIALGEIGLDYHYDLSPRQVQKEVFKKQIEISIKNKKPIIIHCREAHEDMIDILKQYPTLPKGIIHSFDGSLKQAQIYIDMGFLIGICSTITFPKSDEIRQIAAELDISKLLVETDCPYRAPQKFRGKRSEPAYVIEIIEELAKVRKMPFSEVENITTQNALSLFLERK